jgi:hypothetical protein
MKERALLDLQSYSIYQHKVEAFGSLRIGLCETIQVASFRAGPVAGTFGRSWSSLLRMTAAATSHIGEQWR